MRSTKVHLAALAFVAGVLPAAVSADGWFSRMGDAKEVTLTDLLKSPREYVDVEVTVKVYFDAPGKNFNPYFTRFNEEAWGNFSAWPIDARLYDKRDYPRPYPFFFASKMDKSWKKMKDIDHLRIIEIRGVVRDVFKGQPWIEVLDWSSASGGLSDSDIRDVIEGDANYVAGHYKDAARLYERADSSSLPDGVRADLQRRLGDAYFRAGSYGDAKDAYETGLRHAPDSTVLKQGADASEAARQRAKAARKGQAVEGDSPEVAPAEEPVVASNGTDEVIRLLEDPEKVAAEVQNWRNELEARAAALRGDAPGATPVAGTEPEAQPVEAAPEEAPEATEPAVEHEPVEGCAEHAPEGCGQPAEQGQEGCAQQPEATQPAETTQPAEGSEPADAGHEGCAQAPEATQPVETAQPTETAQPAEHTEAGEQPEGTPEGAANAGEPANGEEPATTTGEGACGGTTETPAEGCSQPAEQGGSEAGNGGEQACGNAQGTGTETPSGDETAAAAGDERVVWVSGQMIRMPRLPFFGCEDVTDDDLRAIIQDVVQNPETDE